MNTALKVFNNKITKMVFLHFPNNYTDEEHMLQAKYAKLKKKKKALEQMKVPKIEPEKVTLKRPLDPKDAKEFAKKMIQSGKVSLPNKQPVEKTVFKRPRTLERKILATGRSEGHGGFTPGYNANYPSTDFQFEPFTPAPASSDPSSPLTPTAEKGSTPRFGIPLTPSPIKTNPFSSPSQKTSSMKDFEDSSDRTSASNNKNQKPKRGPTIYVQAHNITEEILQAEFGKFGKIVNIKLNNPTVGFVTFEKVEIADEAVQQMNGATVNDINYEVQFARRQPNIAQLMMTDGSASATWTAIAASNSQKSNFQDRRTQVIYDEPMES